MVRIIDTSWGVSQVFLTEKIQISNTQLARIPYNFRKNLCTRGLHALICWLSMRHSGFLAYKNLCKEPPLKTHRLSREVYLERITYQFFDIFIRHHCCCWQLNMPLDGPWPVNKSLIRFPRHVFHMVMDSTGVSVFPTTMRMKP